MAYDIGPKIGVDGEKEFRNQINSINTALRTTKEEMQAVASSFDEGEDSQEAYSAKTKVLIKQIGLQRDKLALLQRGLEESSEKYGENDSRTQRWQQTVHRATVELNKMEGQLRETADRVGELSTELKDKFASGAKAVGASVAAISAAVVGLVEGTAELRGDLSKLEANARSAGVGFEEANEVLLHFNAITGETDSSIEAISNLLMTGLTGNTLTEAVEALSGAVIRFPDTLKIESLADSLQETLATSNATGQFGELLERLGYNLDDFNKGLKDCTTSADKQRYALKHLADAGLKDANAEYVKNNKVVIENSKAQLRLQEAMAAIGQKFAPLVSKGMNKIADAAGGFVDGPLDALVDAGEWAIDHGEEIISVIAGIGSGILAYKAIKGVSDIVETFVDLKNAIAAAKVAQEALNFAQLASPIALIGSLIIGAGTALASYCASLPEVESKNMKLAKSFEENEEAIDELSAKISEASEARRKHSKEIGAEAVVVKKLSSELENLVAKEDKTAVEKQRIASIVQKLNELMPELNLSYDKQADKLNRSAAEMRNFVASFERAARIKAAQDDLTEAFENQYEAAKLVADITAQYNEAVIKAEEAERAHTEALEMSDEAMAEHGLNINVLRDARDLARQSVEEYKLQLEEANMALGVANEQYESTVDWINQYSGATAMATQSVNEMGMAQVEWKDKVIETTPEAAASFELFKLKYEEVRQVAETSIHQQMGLFEDLRDDTSVTIGAMTESLKRQAEELNNWGKNLEIASRKGINEGLLKELANAGPESAKYLSAISGATDDEIDAMNKAWESKYAAEKYASEEMAGAVTGVKGEMNKLYNFTMNEKHRYYSSGVNAMEGFGNGAENYARNTLYRRIASLADQCVNIFNSRMGIESPSKVFRASGRYSMQGYMLGWEDEAKDIGSRMSKSIPTSFDIEYEFNSKTGRSDSGLKDTLVDAFSTAILKANFSIEMNGREFGRAVEGAV